MSQSLVSRSVHLLYAEHHGWLQGWLNKKLGCSQQAADLAQDTFLRLLSRPQRDMLREPRAYLTTIAHGLMVNHWRRLELERAWQESLAALPEALAPSPEHQALALEALHEVDALIRRMPPKVRSAFLMAQLDGLKYAEIAQRLGVSERMVKKYMSQAMLQCLTLELAL